MFFVLYLVTASKYFLSFWTFDPLSNLILPHVGDSSYYF